MTIKSFHNISHCIVTLQHQAYKKNQKDTSKDRKGGPAWPCAPPKKNTTQKPSIFAHLCNVHRWWWASATSQVGKSPTKNQTQSLPQSHQKPRSWAQTPNKRARIRVVNIEIYVYIYIHNHKYICVIIFTNICANTTLYMYVYICIFCINHMYVHIQYIYSTHTTYDTYMRVINQT